LKHGGREENRRRFMQKKVRKSGKSRNRKIGEIHYLSGLIKGKGRQRVLIERGIVQLKAESKNYLVVLLIVK